MKHLDVRLKAILLTVALVFSTVLVVKFWPGTISYKQVAEASNTTSLFNKAVDDLRQRRYRQAIDSFREVLKETPTMPEVYVNIGFANYELKQYEQAIQAFDTAIELRSGQINAYWGLAVSFEGLCEIQAAIGAMSTFTHLAEPDTAYMRKAESALWEWRQMKKEAEQRGDNKIVCQ